MKKPIFTFIPLVMLLATNAVQAENAVSETSTQALGRLYMGDEMIGVKPALGFNVYNDDRGGRSTRMSYGVAAEMNLASPIGVDYTRWFVGPQTGITFSHLGRADASFFGTSGMGSGGGANLIVIPLNLKVAMAPVNWFRTGVHGGANLIYRSIASAVRLDDTDLNWRLIPNFGADFDFAVSKQVALSVRPDWTLSATQSMYSATIALGIALD